MALHDKKEGRDEGAGDKKDMIRTEAAPTSANKEKKRKQRITSKDG
jgi:hypothetical protein